MSTIISIGAPSVDRKDTVEMIREKYNELADILSKELPYGRRRERSLEYLEDSSMLAVKSIYIE